MTRVHISQPHIEVGSIENEGIQEPRLPVSPSTTAVRVRSNVGGVSGLRRFGAQPLGEVGDQKGLVERRKADILRRNRGMTSQRYMNLGSGSHWER